MIIDAQARFFNAQAVTSAAVISNIYDTLSSNTPARNIGRGQPLRLVATIDTTFAGGTALTLTYEQSANPDGSSSTVLSTGAVGATPAAGTKAWDVHVPQNTQRYVFVRATPTGTYTAGALSAELVSDTDGNPYYTANTGL
jgi:hypothetical protein